MLYYTILYYTILYYTILYYTILYYTILYYTILILYYTIQDIFVVGSWLAVECMAVLGVCFAWPAKRELEVRFEALHGHISICIYKYRYACNVM